MTCRPISWDTGAWAAQHSRYRKTRTEVQGRTSGASLGADPSREPTSQPQPSNIAVTSPGEGFTRKGERYHVPPTVKSAVEKKVASPTTRRRGEEQDGRVGGRVGRRDVEKRGKRAKTTIARW